MEQTEYGETTGRVLIEYRDATFGTKWIMSNSAKVTIKYGVCYSCGTSDNDCKASLIDGLGACCEVCNEDW